MALSVETTRHPFKLDDHSKVVPLLPIPNRIVKRLCADDSAGSRVKVGHCQAITAETARSKLDRAVFLHSLHPMFMNRRHFVVSEPCTKVELPESDVPGRKAGYLF